MTADVRPRLSAATQLGVAATVVAAIVLPLASKHLSTPGGGRAVDSDAAALVVLATLATGLAARYPLTGAALCAVSLGCYLGRHHPYGPILGTGLVTAFLIGWRAGRRKALIAVALLEASILVGRQVSGREDVLVLLYLGWALAAAALGSALRIQQRLRDEQQARDASQERGRQAEARQREVEQRLRIARDLHDGVAHAMATINVQAAAAARVVDRQPEAAGQALMVIANASGTVLDELNAVVTLLRDHDRPADRVPTPGLANVADLVSSATRSGLTCDLVLRADPARVGAAVGTAAYRIVQESLTNVLRHSGAARVQVSVVETEGGGLDVQIRDDGSGVRADSPGTGTGIAGMRERVEATGGSFLAARRPGGFEVRAQWAGEGL